MRLSTAKSLKNSFLKRFSEMLFNNRIGNMIDTALMKITAKRWLKKKQMKKLNTNGIIMGMDTDKHYSKPEPGNFQDKLIGKYQNKVSQLLERCVGSVVR